VLDQHLPEEPATGPTGPGGRPLRVAHLTTIDTSLLLLLGRELQADVEAGFEVFGLSAPGPHVADIERLGVHHIPVPALSRSWDLRADGKSWRQLRRVIAELNLDVLHTHNPKSGVLGRLAGRSCRVPVIVNTCHGLWLRPGDSFARKAFVLGAEGFAARVSHAELYQNGEDLKTMSRFVSAGKSRLVGNGIDLGHFRPDAAQRRRVRAELRVADNELLVGGVGRLVMEKGIREYAEAARALAGTARFVWVGPDDPAKADALADGEDGIAFLGERRDMPAVYAALDVFVLPSYREGFSRSAMEAAASGLPMVLSDISGCREIGRDGTELRLVPPADSAALRAAIAELLGDPELRQRLGSAARERALAAFDQREVAMASIATYRAVADRRRLGWSLPRPSDRSAEAS
jgi:glycosyltransferase involved in cell wall biosynthesis